MRFQKASVSPLKWPSGRREVSASPFTVCFQEASVAPLQCASRRLWFHLYSQPSESSGFTLYSALPGSFGFTSTVNLQEASVSPLRYAPRKLRFHLYSAPSGSFGLHVYSEPSRSCGFTFYIALPGSFGFISTVCLQKLRFHVFSEPSGSCGFTSYSALPGNFGFTSTGSLQEAPVLPRQCTSRKVRVLPGPFAYPQLVRRRQALILNLNETGRHARPACLSSTCMGAPGAYAQPE